VPLRFRSLRKYTSRSRVHWMKRPSALEMWKQQRTFLSRRRTDGTFPRNHGISFLHSACGLPEADWSKLRGAHPPELVAFVPTVEYLVFCTLHTCFWSALEHWGQPHRPAKLRHVDRFDRMMKIYDWASRWRGSYAQNSTEMRRGMWKR
jgi:hypothetical protein